MITGIAFFVGLFVGIALGIVLRENYACDHKWEILRRSETAYTVKCKICGKIKSKSVKT
jgi:uncharacterized metal-binding protein